MINIHTLVEIIMETLDYKGKPIVLHEPSFVGNEWKYVKECIDTGWVSSVGKFVDQFEQTLADFIGAKHAIATVNGTSALHISYLLAGVGAGDEVLVPTLTFVGTINPVIYCGAIPHFIDAEERSLGIDPDVLGDYLQDIITFQGDTPLNRFTGRPIKALCVMHTLGHPVDLDPILAICQKYRITLIEDAAEGLGSYYKGVHVGSKGLFGIFSFNGNKIITTGGGGAIVTNNTELAKKAKHITTTAKLTHPWAFHHNEVGYNYRLPNINAALGCAQLELLPYFLKAKRQLATKYQQSFANIPGIKFIQEPSYASSNHWLNALLIDSAFADSRDKLIELLSNKNIMTRPLWELQHTLSMFQHYPRMPLPIAENLQKRLIKLPSSAQLAPNFSLPKMQASEL